MRPNALDVPAAAMHDCLVPVLKRPCHVASVHQANARASAARGGPSLVV